MLKLRQKITLLKSVNFGSVMQFRVYILHIEGQDSINMLGLDTSSRRVGEFQNFRGCSTTEMQ